MSLAVFVLSVGLPLLVVVAAGLWSWRLYGRVQADIRALRLAEDRLAVQASVIDQVSESIMTFDTERRTTSWNRGAERLFGVRADAILGRRLTDILPFKVAQPELESVYSDRRRQGLPFEGEFVVTLPDGTTKLVGGTVSPLRGADGKPAGVVAVMADIALRKRSESELKARARQQAAVAALGQRALAGIDLALVLDQAAALVAHTLDVPIAGLFELDPATDRFQLRAGEGWPSGPGSSATLPGRESHAGQLLLSGRPLLVEDLPGDARLAVDPLLARAGVRGIVAVAVHGARQPFGVLGAYSTSPRVFTRDDVHFLQSVANVLGTSMDRVRAEEERRQLEAQMTHVQKLESLGVLAGGIAHDFNNLLVGIMGHAGLALMDLAPDSPLVARLRHIETAAQRAAELTNQMLAYSGRGHFVVQPVDLSRLVEEMGHLLRTATSKNAAISYDCGRELPTIQGDPSQLRQVVMNLITNASDALGDSTGSIALRTGVVHAGRDFFKSTYLNEDLPAGDYVFVEVRDSGCGMSRDTLSRIFEPFFTTKFTGRGLGLAAVLGIVRGHRGAIRIDSVPGGGTTFQVYFPAAVVPLPAAPDRASVPPAADWRGQGTVLIVDDEAGVRDVAQSVLERAGLTVLTAIDGQDGVDTFQAHRDGIDLVLLDMTMPRLNGALVLSQIRHLRPDIPVIVSTGYGEQDTLDRVRDHEAVGFIQKPYSTVALLELVRDFLAPPLLSPPPDTGAQEAFAHDQH